MDRGDIVSVDLDPTVGHEQRGHRPVLVISKAEFNKLGAALICPISQGGGFARSAGWAVSLANTGLTTHGVVLCHQPRTVDLVARKARRIETAPDVVVDEVLARVQVILE
jgi:mRNA interferase ChpB